MKKHCDDSFKETVESIRKRLESRKRIDMNCKRDKIYMEDKSDNREDAEEQVWRTINGSPVLINVKSGEIVGGAGGKFNGKKFGAKRSKAQKSVKLGKSGTSGEVISGKNGNLKPKSDGAKRIGTKDALEEFKKYGKKNSLTKYLDDDGNLSPERQAVHDQIIKNFFKDKLPADGQPTLEFSGGGPASGKSFVRKEAEKKFGTDKTATIDPDDFKKMLPGYTNMAVKTDEAASFYHEESSALAKRAYQYAADNGINVVYDGTGDGSVNSVLKKLKTARDAGYKINGTYVTVDVPEALTRNRKRYEDAVKAYESGDSRIPPRLPKANDVIKIHREVSKIHDKVAHLFDTFALYDNNGPTSQPPVKIATCAKGGKIQVESGQEEAYRSFVNKKFVSRATGK